MHCGGRCGLPPIRSMHPCILIFMPAAFCHRGHHVPSDNVDEKESPVLMTAIQTSEDYMEVILACLDAIRRRGAEAMPQLRDAFAAASQTLQVPHTTGGSTHEECFALHGAERPLERDRRND